LAVSLLERCDTGSFVDFSRLPVTETSRMAQHCGPTAAVAFVSRDPTFAPRTPATSPENNRRVHLSLVCPRRGLFMGHVSGKGANVQYRPQRRPTVQSLCHACHPATAAEAASVSTDSHGLQP